MSWSCDYSSSVSISKTTVLVVALLKTHPHDLSLKSVSFTWGKIFPVDYTRSKRSINFRESMVYRTWLRRRCELLVNFRKSATRFCESKSVYCSQNQICCEILRANNANEDVMTWDQYNLHKRNSVNGHLSPLDRNSSLLISEPHQLANSKSGERTLLCLTRVVTSNQKPILKADLTELLRFRYIPRAIMLLIT